MNNEPEPPPSKTYNQMIYDWWSNLDWNKSNMDLCSEYDVNYVTVARWRDNITGRANPKHPARKLNIDWDSLDWNQNDTSLAKEYKIPYADVRRARIKLKKPFPLPGLSKHRRKIDPAKLAAVDWEFTKDLDIASQLGVSRERVRQLRNDTQKPACLVAGLGANNTECYKWIVKNKETLEGKSRREISEMFDNEHKSLLNRTEIYKVIKKTGIRVSLERESRKDCSHLYDKINFDLPNIVLQMIYDLSFNSVGSYRNRMMKDGPRWRLGGYSKLINDEGFIAELEAEKAKAIALGFKVDSDRIDKWLKWKRDYTHPHTKAKQEAKEL